MVDDVRPAKCLYHIHTSGSEQTERHVFLDAPGGCAKTFLIETILSTIRSERKIAIDTASSGLAATLLTGGRTVHSTFKVPLDITRTE